MNPYFTNSQLTAESCLAVSILSAVCIMLMVEETDLSYINGFCLL